MEVSSLSGANNAQYLPCVELLIPWYLAIQF